MPPPIYVINGAGAMLLPAPPSILIMAKTKYMCAVAALVVAAVLSFLSFHATNDITANMLILVAQFLMYSLTLFGFGELANRMIKTIKNER